MSDIEQIISQLTLDEKISLLAGQNLWHTVPVPRLGIPSVKMSDGPNGVRGAWRELGPPSISVPVGIALGATWNDALVADVGALLAEEMKLKSAHILLAPTVNIHRTPIAGRNFECYAEDPFLSGRMATAYIDGLQKNGVAACIKHFVANDQEFERNSISAAVDERALHEIYLEPFRRAIFAARPWSIMTAYNRINGTYASEHDYLLKQVLKGDWEYDGLVISDWFGTYTPAVPAGGLDLEMPGKARWMSTAHVRAALDSGELTAAALDDKVRRLLRLAERVDARGRLASAPERENLTPARQARIRAAAQETIVLLKNDGVLPLDPEKKQKIAVIGALAYYPNILGGGSAQLHLPYVVSPLQGIRERAGAAVDVAYAPGCFLHKALPSFDKGTLRTFSGEEGLDLAIFDNLDMSGAPAFSRVVAEPDFGWFEASIPNVDQSRFSFQLSGTFTPRTSGRHGLGLTCFGQSRVYLDGELVLDCWEAATPYYEGSVTVEMTAGKSYMLNVEYRWDGPPRWRAMRLGHLPPHAEDLIGEAVALAEAADAVVLLAGLTYEWESEGFDRPTMDLPGAQDELIARVVAANPNTIVVLNAGSVVSMPWVDQVPAIVNQWYNSIECGHALADILFGDVSPSGKLPTTYPRRLEDNPAYINYPGENGQVRYGEGIFVGYRYYEKKGITPLFPFGYGLSYTTFAYSDIKTSADRFLAGDGVDVTVTVSNSGDRAGREIVQVYVRDVESLLVRPEKELKGFAKIALEPGESRQVTIHLDETAFWYYNPTKGGWQVEAGQFEILVGASSQDIRQRALVQVLAPAGSLSTHTSLRELLASEHGRAVLERFMSEFVHSRDINRVLEHSLADLAAHSAVSLAAEELAAIDAALAAGAAVDEVAAHASSAWVGGLGDSGG